MPTIKEYQQTVGPAGPGAVQNIPLGIADAAAAKGRVLGQALSQAASTIHDIGEKIDKSRVQKNLAVARADLTIEMQNAVQSGDAATPDFEKRFSDRAAARLEKDNKGYHTNTGVQLSSVGGTQMISEFRTQANHYQAVAVGQQAALAYKEATDAGLTVVTDDPMQLKSALNENLAAIQDPNGNFAGLSAQKRAELVSETTGRFGMASLRGVIRNVDPNLAVEMLKNNTGGAELLSAEQRRQMEGEADQGIRYREIEDERRVKLQEREERKAREATKLDFQGKLNAPGGPTLSVREIQNSNLTSEEVEHYVRLTKEGVGKTNPVVANQVLSDIISGKITERGQYSNLLGRGLTYADMVHADRELANGAAGTEKRTAILTAARFLDLESLGEPGFAVLSWQRELSEKWEAKVKAKEDPTVLIRAFPGNNENMVTPDRLRAHMQTFAQLSDAQAAEQAAAVADARKALAGGGGKPPPTVNGPADWTEDKVPPGSLYVHGKTGKLMRRPLAVPEPASGGAK